jgi:hypothetical protein
MVDFSIWEDDKPPSLGDLLGTTHPRDTTIQILFSLTLGVGAFLSFCILRPRWGGLYAARKRQNDETALPELPNSFFGWIMPLWRITDQQILASAGLDAYVFLTFFKMAMKFLFLTLIFSLIVIKPVHDANPEDDPITGNGTDHGNHTKHAGSSKQVNLLFNDGIHAYNSSHGNFTLPYIPDFENDWLWMYVIFAYLFSGIAIYLIISTTRKVIEVRQEYLGSQTTVTDRTIRLSGIPKYMQHETKIKEFVESLDIGRVESVTLCRNWKELDQAMDKRMDILRRLEEAYTVYMGYQGIQRAQAALPVIQQNPPQPILIDDSIGDDQETSGLIQPTSRLPRWPYTQSRPKAVVRYGFMKLRMRRVDAIELYETQLKEIDDRIKRLRESEFDPVPLAFITMDSVASCQMTIQAVLHPSPLQLIANQSPTPTDVIWPNTYMSRSSRMIRAWTVTLIIGLLTITWVVIFIPIAGLLNLEAIRKVLPQLAEALEVHENIRSLINTQVPTLIASLLMVLVPYLYYGLSWCQGEISKGDIELSSISKNFFFTFFNFFVVFMVLGTASTYLSIAGFFEKFGDALKDFRTVAYTLALSLQALLSFYVNFIILQGIGLFPFRLLEMGSVSLYPIYRMGAKTPRDYAELVQPPIFVYGFYLPNALLIFIICMVYSVLRQSWQVLLAGLLYFMLGHFVYKYQLLYAMDHRQQATGRAWGMICDRIFMGLIFFQLTTAGQLVFKQAPRRSVLMVPLLAFTMGMSVVYGKTYKPLMKFIALSSVRREERYADGIISPPGESSTTTSLSASAIFSGLERNVWADITGFPSARANLEARSRRRRKWHRPGEDDDEGIDTDTKFINPSLVVPLRGVWIAGEGHLSPQDSSSGYGATSTETRSPDPIEVVADGEETV